jgi:hypothetical protein
VIPAENHAGNRPGTAIAVSGLSTVFGFAAFISNFGIVTIITVGFSLIGVMVVMPAILVLPIASMRGNGRDESVKQVSLETTILEMVWLYSSS